MLRLVSKEIRSTAFLAGPLVLANLAQLALTTTTLMLIGRLGAEDLAAGALAASLYHAFMMFSMGVISAAMPMFAHEIGKEQTSTYEVRCIVREGFWSAILLSIALWIVLWHSDRVLIALGQSPVLSNRSLELMHALQWSLLPYLGYIVLRSFLATLEKALAVLLVVMVAVIFNAVVGWLLIFGHGGFPALGLRGAGIASALANLILFLGLLLAVTADRRFRRYCIFARIWSPDRGRLAAFWRLGLPIGITLLLESSIFYGAVVMMGWIGASTLAAHAIVSQIALIALMVPLGFSQAATVRVGRAAGAGNQAAVKLAGWVAYGLAAGSMVLSAIAFLLFPELFLAAFVDRDAARNSAVIALGVQLLACAALFQVADGIQVVTTGMLRGLHDTKIPMVLAAIGYWAVGLPLSGFLAFYAELEGVGVWIGLVIGLTTVAILTTLRWILLIKTNPHRWLHSSNCLNCEKNLASARLFEL
jgi:MATE family multidrug resistance protein